MTGSRVLVCGGHDYDDRDRMREVLDHLRISALCHGTATGADTLAGAYAISHHIPCQAFPADWNQYGKAAGPMRNAQMLVDFRPDLVVAFPGGRGTADMMAKAEYARVTVIQVFPR